MRFAFSATEMKKVADMNLTNDEFFKSSNCMYFTDEVSIRVEGD